MVSKPKGGSVKLHRAEILLRAAYDILEKCDKSGYVVSALEQTAHYDGTDCDGRCLMDDIAIELQID